MKLQSSGVLYGVFQATFYDVKDGQRKLFRRVTKKNQITNEGRLATLRLLDNTFGSPNLELANFEYNQLWWLGIGDDPTPPTAADISLGLPVWTSKILPAERVYQDTIYEIWINKTLSETEANGHTLCEAGIFTRGDDPDNFFGIPHYQRLFARQSHAGVPKNDHMIVVYDWRIGMTVQI